MEQEPTEPETSLQDLPADSVETTYDEISDGEVDDPVDRLWANPLVAYPGGLRQRVVRVDEDVFDWFADKWPDFEVRINEALRKHIDSVE